MTRVVGELKNSNATFILHPCNCVSDKAVSPYADVFLAFPYADIYTRRNTKPKPKDPPGGVSIHGDGKKERYVINVLVQRYPGKSNYPNDAPDKRQKWFIDGLSAIEDLDAVKEAVAQGDASIAIPEYLKYSLSESGPWEEFDGIMESFSAKTGLSVVLVKREKNGDGNDGDASGGGGSGGGGGIFHTSKKRGYTNTLDNVRDNDVREVSLEGATSGAPPGFNFGPSSSSSKRERSSVPDGFTSTTSSGGGGMPPGFVGSAAAPPGFKAAEDDREFDVTLKRN